MWPCFQGLVDRQFRESQLILPPLSDFVNDNDSVSSVDSDPGGDRYSTMPERAYWPYHKRLHWAVHMVQRAYRGHQVRNAIRKLVSSIFVKKWDKKKRACALCSRACLLCYMCGYRVYQRIAARVHTGQFYFLDTRNGNIRWIKPHGARAESIALKVMCVECDLNPATKCCVECEDSYCDECYDGRHQKGARREHSYAPIVEATKICPYCKEAVQFRFCENCEQGHCVSCYEDRHKKGKKKRHKWRRMLQNIEWNFTDFPQPVDVCQYCGINMQNVTCDDCDDLYWYVPNVLCAVCSCVCMHLPWYCFCVVRSSDCWSERHARGKRAFHVWHVYPQPTKYEAAVRIQSMYRMWKGRRRMLKRLRKTYTQEYNEEHDTWVWTHLPTGFEFWHKPPLFGSHDLARTPRNLSVEEAAIELQRMWRARKARRLLRKLVMRLYEKVLDEETGEVRGLGAVVHGQGVSHASALC